MPPTAARPAAASPPRTHLHVLAAALCAGDLSAAIDTIGGDLWDGTINPTSGVTPDIPVDVADMVAVDPDWEVDDPSPRSSPTAP